MLFMHMELFTYNRTFTLILTICLCTVFMSCGEHHKVKRMISDFSASEIILPEELECIYKKQVRPIVKDTLKPYKYIIYYDSYDCSSCRIAKLTDNYPLYSFADINKISPNSSLLYRSAKKWNNLNFLSDCGKKQESLFSKFVNSINIFKYNEE